MAHFAEMRYGLTADGVLAIAEEVVGKNPYFATVAEAPQEPITPMSVSGTIWAGRCGYKQGNDTPHHSNTTGTRNVSVHGYWLVAGGSCPSQADVTIILEAVCDC